MINLRKRKLEQQKPAAKKSAPAAASSVRDKLLVQEVQEMEKFLPKGCSVTFNNPNKLHQFVLTVKPCEGYWAEGRFSFNIDVPTEYNIAPPKVKCTTRLWHPNITESGEICLSLLRQRTVDSSGWAPTRRLKDVVWGLNSLFTDLLNFDDPLNVEAADQHQQDKDGFIEKAKSYVKQFAM